MRTSTLLFWGFIFACFLSCEEQKPPKDSRFDKIAKGYCECTGPLIALNRQAAELAKDTTGNAAPLFKQMEQEYQKAKECCATIIAQFGKIKKEEMTILEQTMTGYCPDMGTQRDLLQEMLGE